MKFPGLLHDPVTRSSRRVEAEVDPASARLLVPVGDGVHDVDAAELETATGGWDGGMVHLSWVRDSRQWALTVDDPAALAELSRTVPALASLAQQAHAGRERVRRSGRWSMALLASIVLVPLLLLALLFVFREPLVEAVVRRLPASVDVQLGSLVSKQLDAGGLRVPDGPAPAAVRAIGERLLRSAPAHPYQFRFEVVRDPSLNAYAAPGGLVVVHTGLLSAADTPEEVAGVLAHEITHVLHRHSMRQLVLRAGVTGAVRLLVGDAEGAAEKLGGAAAELGALRFSRDQERDADAGGLALLRGARLPADGMVTFFGKLAKQGGQPPAMLSSHPPSEERAAALRTGARRWPVQPLDVDWAAVKEQAAGR